VDSRRRILAWLGTLALDAGLGACGLDAGKARSGAPTEVVFKAQRLGRSGALQEILRAFERAHPGVFVRLELLPSASGSVHQYYVTALEGKTQDFDVLLLDVVWVAELARAGWIADLSEAFPPAHIQRDFLPGPASAVIVDGATYAVPWYADVGMLYRRIDLVPRAPQTFAELIDFAAPHVNGRRMRGYLWQALQSEALVCNVFEAIWGHGGVPSSPSAVELDTEPARAALVYLRSLIRGGVSPPGVTSMAEEEARRVFQAGAAVLMRNWPYAFADAERAGSAVQGRIGMSPLPTLSGAPGHGALGGFQLALNAHTPAHKVDAARALIAALSSPMSNLVLAVAYGRLPARLQTYQDPALLSGAPIIAGLLPAARLALPRPVTPYYPMLEDTLAAEFSAAITGVRPPAEALGRAQALADRLTRGRA
jgi:multiple sugar transport system substrate-binding protein